MPSAAEVHDGKEENATGTIVKVGALIPLSISIAA
jgi:hypothetical protein